MTTREITIEPVSLGKRRKALNCFQELLNSETRESDWQAFFDENPFVFSDALSIKIDALYSQVPLVSGIPDYVFFRKAGTRVTGDYGVIELKRPNQSILGTYSSKIIVPSRSLRVAQQEVSQHLESIQRGQFLNSDDFFIAGNRRHAFIILGLSSELTLKCQKEIYRLQFQNILPNGFHLYTYDELLELFAATVPPTLQVLFVASASCNEEEVIQVFKIGWKYGLHLRPCAWLCRTAEHFVSNISFRCGARQANSNSIMSLMQLAAPKGSNLEVKAIGFDARSAISAIGKLIRSDFYMADDSPGLRTKQGELDRLWADSATINPVEKKRMIDEAAYYLAEHDGFQRDPRSYWCKAEDEINKNLRFGEFKSRR